MSELLKTIEKAVLAGDHKLVVKTVNDALDSGMSASDILDKGLIQGVQALGDLFKDGKVYLPEVLIATRAMNMGVEELKDQLIDSDRSMKGTVVLGTVEGDLHDIGKNLVALMLEGNGFNVIDVGVDVKVDSFISAARENDADIIAMSGLLTTTIPYFSTVIEALEDAGLKDKVKVMIGGAPVTKGFAEDIGADGFADDCASAVDEATRLVAI